MCLFDGSLYAYLELIGADGGVDEYRCFGLGIIDFSFSFSFDLRFL